MSPDKKRKKKRKHHETLGRKHVILQNQINRRGDRSALLFKNGGLLSSNFAGDATC